MTVSNISLLQYVMKANPQNVRFHIRYCKLPLANGESCRVHAVFGVKLLQYIL